MDQINNPFQQWHSTIQLLGSYDYTREEQTHSLWRLGGRVTIVKSILCSIPLYTIQSQNMTMGMQKKVERVLTRFIWSHNKNSIHWASWSKMSKPGGFGFRSLKESASYNAIKWGLDNRTPYKFS